MVGLFVLAAGLLQKMLIQRAVASRFRAPGDPDAVHVLTGVITLLRALRSRRLPLRPDKLGYPERIDKFIVHFILYRHVPFQRRKALRVSRKSSVTPSPLTRILTLLISAFAPISRRNPSASRYYFYDIPESRNAFQRSNLCNCSCLFLFRYSHHRAPD